MGFHGCPVLQVEATEEKEEEDDEMDRTRRAQTRREECIRSFSWIA
jgi:hypothetical protein